MRAPFQDRAEAGRALADLLERFADREDAIVLALPRGGVPVGAEIAKHLRLPLDVFVVRKLGLPFQPELAMGAIASGGVRVLNREVVQGLNVPAEVIEAVSAQEESELKRREQLYRGDLPAPLLDEKTIILVDDGIATGSTMRAAVRALRTKKVRSIVVAAPVMSSSGLQEMEEEADEVATLIASESFHGVGEFYADFGQTTDEEVRMYLGRRG
jgi:putative phosphoribosyl transferase